MTLYRLVCLMEKLNASKRMQHIQLDYEIYVWIVNWNWMRREEWKFNFVWHLFSWNKVHFLERKQSKQFDHLIGLSVGGMASNDNFYFLVCFDATDFEIYWNLLSVSGHKMKTFRSYISCKMKTFPLVKLWNMILIHPKRRGYNSGKC